jgi:threonine/homoserine/homoserine lactone efflux protein
MPSIEILLVFLTTTAMFATIPGPAMLYVAAQTVARGRRAGLMASLGLHFGCYAHVIAAAAGLSVIFHAVPTAYLAVKLAGASYLIWLGISMFRSKEKPEELISGTYTKTAKRAFIESMSVEVLNPKTAIFFVAFLPQFIDSTASMPVWAQFLVLGTIVNVIFSSVDLICVMFANVLATRLRHSSKAQRLMQRLGGTVLVGLGAHLALQKS